MCIQERLLSFRPSQDDTAADLVDGALEEAPVMTPVHIHVTKDGCSISPEGTENFVGTYRSESTSKCGNQVHSNGKMISEGPGFWMQARRSPV